MEVSLPYPDSTSAFFLSFTLAACAVFAGFSAVSDSLPMPKGAKAEIVLAPRDGGMNVEFGDILHCVAAEPHATFLRVGIVDGRREVAYEIAVLGRLKRGFRVLQMRSCLGTRIELCCLLVRISFGSELNKWASPRQQERQLRQQHEVALLLHKRIEGLEATLDVNNMLSTSVHAFDGYVETAARLIFPYSTNFLHLSGESPPLHMAILENGEVDKQQTPLWLGGTWTHADLELMNDRELRELSNEQNVELDKSAARHAIVEALVGRERDVELCDAALISLPMLQTMPNATAAWHLTTSPNSNFVWARDDGTVALVRTWRVRYNDAFRAAFECSPQNPDENVFSTRKVAEFRRAMRNLFGEGADWVPLIYARKRTRNPHLVLVGSREALIDFLGSRPDVLDALGILEIFADGFVAAVKIDGNMTGIKRCTIAEEGQSVIYVKSGVETVAQVKPLHLFDAECQLGKPLIMRSDLLQKLSEPTEESEALHGERAGERASSALG